MSDYYAIKTGPFRTVKLPAGPVGVALGNTTRITQALTGSPIRPVGPLAFHSANGEDATRTTSEHWAITKEPVSPTRVKIEALMANAIVQGNPITYQQASELLVKINAQIEINRLQAIADDKLRAKIAAEQAAAAAKKRYRRSNRKTAAYRAKHL